MKNIILISLFYLLSFEILASNIIEVTERPAIARRHELDERIRILEKAVQELQIKMQHMEAGKEFKDLKVYNCTLEAPLIGSFSETMPSRDKAIERVVQTCKKKSSNASACNSSNAVCVESPL